MTFQEILEGITRHRAEPLRINQPSQTVIASDVVRKLDEIEWALQAMAEALRDREQELSAVAPHERAGHSADYTVGDPVDDVDEVDDAFDEFEKRK